MPKPPELHLRPARCRDPPAHEWRVTPSHLPLGRQGYHAGHSPNLRPRQNRKALEVAVRCLASSPLHQRSWQDCRDRGSPLIGLGGALRRSEPVASHVADIDETESGLLMRPAAAPLTKSSPAALSQSKDIAWPNRNDGATQVSAR